MEPWRKSPRSGGSGSGRSRRSRRLAQTVAVIVLAAVVSAVTWLALTHPDGLRGAEDGARVVFLFLVLVLAASGLTICSMKDLGRSFRHAGLWLMVFAGLITGYGFKPEAQMLWQRMTGALNPAGGAAGADAVSYHMSQGGHFMVDADVDGVTVRFLVDTGASRVVLNHRDARRVGIDPGALDYTQPFSSANGQGWGAPVRLGRVSTGPVTVRNVRATVNKADMNTSLLGMSFLSNTGGYSVQNGVLTIRR